MITGFDNASFKDPEGRVVLGQDRVFRTLARPALERFERLEANGFLGRMVDTGILLPSSIVSAKDADLPIEEFGEKVMEHELISVFSYPYEWSFSMLRDAALVTLNLLEECLKEGLTLKDGSAFNLTFYNGRMRFIDTLSIDDYHEGRPWEGYAQFCREFLFPLMLTAYRRIEFQQWLRGSITGIPVAQIARALSFRDRFRPGVLTNVVLQAHFEKAFATQNVNILKEASSIISRESVIKTARKLKGLINGFHYKTDNSTWIDYVEDNTYSDEETAIKASFVEAAVKKSDSEQIVDLGCNIGMFSRIAARTARRVISLDIDPACIDTFYRVLLQEGVTNIIPMVVDLTDPSPPLGWNLCERRALFDRIGSNGFLALALVHHICIGKNVPLIDFVKFLTRVGKWGVVEWIDKNDDMVRKLLLNRKDVFPEYKWETFKKIIETEFTIKETRETHAGHRILCYITAKNR